MNRLLLRRLQAAADRQVCSDLNARGGAFYNSYVVRVMGAGGYTSVSIEPISFANAVDSLELIGQAPAADGVSQLSHASPGLADNGADLVTSARAFSVYAHADATALLTGFVGTAAECTKAGHQPSWFDVDALRSGTAAATASSSVATAPAMPSPSPMSSASSGTGEYPKKVALSELDYRYAHWLGSGRGTKYAVQLAPGVYAEMPADGNVGTAADYSSYVGSCTSIKRYSAQYPGGSTCW